MIFLPDDEAGCPRPIRPSAAMRCSALRLELATAMLESVCIGKIDGTRSQGVERRQRLVEPVEMRLTAMEQAGDGIDQDAIGGSTELTTGVAK